MKTIKTILMAAGFIAAMASCKKDEIEDTNLELEDLSDAIGFIVGAPDTKASAVTNDNITTKCSSFTCDVWMASAPQGQSQHLIDKGTVKYIEGVWRFSQKQAGWVSDIETQFWAWAPTDLQPIGMDANASQITFAYTLPEPTPDGTSDATNQKDVLVAYSAKTFNGTDRYVTINFKHALPQINFTAVAEKIADIDITSVMLENVASTGNFTFTSGGVVTCTPSVTKSYGQSSPFEGATEGTLNDKKAFTTTNNFFMIPQKLNGAKITVKKSNGEILTASLSNSTTWLPGKVYNYKLSFSDKALIVTLVDWVDVDGGTINTDTLCMPLWSYYTGEQL